HLETLEEQLAVLDAIPSERIVRQLNDVARWDAYRRAYVRLFLDGDLPGLIALTAGFVTRGPVVVGQRDGRMFEAMHPVFAAEDAVAFIGFPHVPGVTHLFQEAGWTVTQVTV
ncbi:MAG: TraB/GumN family protein, partial [Anaerolineae bacterium]|nr:TraB/GumN family protein [Anaerolineae bacterium]